MLNTFAAAGHHQHAKGARLYCQLINKLNFCLITMRFLKISLLMGTTLFVILAMIDL